MAVTSAVMTTTPAVPGTAIPAVPGAVAPLPAAAPVANGKVVVHITGSVSSSTAVLRGHGEPLSCGDVAGCL